MHYLSSKCSNNANEFQDLSKPNPKPIALFQSEHTVAIKMFSKNQGRELTGAKFKENKIESGIAKW